MPHLAQGKPGLALPVEGGEPGQQDAQEQQQQVDLRSAQQATISAWGTVGFI